MRFLAVFSACLSLVGCMVPGSGSMPPVIAAAREGDVPRLEQLLKSGADPNVRAGVNAWTPLMHAIHKNQPGSVQVLLARGARPNERGGGGTTALIMAAGYGYAGIVRTLLQAGADPHMQADNGTDALSAAVGGVLDIDRFTIGECQTDTVRAMLSAAPDLRLSPDSGAMRIARFGGCSDVLRMMKR
jgi:Ankyrin repeats (3 copies)